MNKNLLGFHEISKAIFWKAVVAELLGTTILIVSACGSAITMDPGNSASIFSAALTCGMTIAMIIWTLNHVSGAHVNPVVTLSFLVTGHLTIAKSIAYIIAQCTGSVIGAAFLWYNVPQEWRGTLASTVFANGVTIGQGFSIEAACTFILLLGIFASADRLRNDHNGSVPLTIGLVVFINIAWTGNLTGGGMNPARTLGPAVMSGSWDHHWVYWAAPTVGGITGAFFYQMVLATRMPEVVSVLEVCEDKQRIEKTVNNGQVSNRCFTVEKEGDKSHCVREIESLGNNL